MSRHHVSALDRDDRHDLERSPPESRLYDFQRDARLDETVELLRSEDRPPVVLLAGRLGSGRAAFCDAVRDRARSLGEKAAVWHLDLEGFELDGPFALGVFSKHLLENDPGRTPAARAQPSAVEAVIQEPSAVEAVIQENFAALESIAKQLAQTDLSASILSLLSQLEEPIERWREMLGEPAQGGVGETDMLRRLLDGLSRGRKLLIHLEDPTQLRRWQRDWFAAEASRNPNLLLAISCRPDDATDELLTLDRLGHEPRRLELEPPAAAASGGELSEELYEPIRDFLAGLRSLGKELQDFLVLAALCGRNVPAELLLAHQRLGEDDATRIIDLIDDHLVDELGVFWDLEFRHPAFPHLNVYRFTHPLWPHVILGQVSEMEQEMTAAVLLPFLDDRLRIDRRGAARLLLAVAGHLGRRERTPYLRQLAWWIGADEVEALAQEVARNIETGELDPELVWTAVAQPSAPLPAYRRFALLEAYNRAVVGDNEPAHVIPFDRVATFHRLRASLLMNLGRVQDTERDVERALETVKPGTIDEATSLNLKGMLLLHLGEPAVAPLEKALELFRRLAGADSQPALTVTINLAAAHGGQGNISRAKELEEQVLESFRRILGPEHPATLDAMRRLAEISRQLDGDAAAS